MLLAYIDPGTGSYLLQIAVAGLLGAGVAIKLFWERIYSTVALLFMRKGGQSDNE